MASYVLSVMDVTFVASPTVAPEGFPDMAFKDLDVFLEQPGQSLLRHLLTLAPIPAGLALDAKIVFANPACGELFGYETPSQMCGKSFFENLAPEWHPMVQEIWMLRRWGTEPLSYELEGIRPDGSRFAHRTTSISLETTKGKLSFAYFAPIDACTPADVQLERLRRDLAISG